MKMMRRNPRPRAPSEAAEGVGRGRGRDREVCPLSHVAPDTPLPFPPPGPVMSP